MMSLHLHIIFCFFFNEGNSGNKNVIPLSNVDTFLLQDNAIFRRLELPKE